MRMEGLKLEEFSGFGTRTGRTISITRSKSFGVSPGFYKENELDCFAYVKLYYDREKQIIGIKFLTEEEQGEGGAFRLVKYNTNEKTGASVLARSFFGHYGIETDKYRGKYTPEKKNIEGVGEVFLLMLKNKEQKESNLDTQK